MSGVVTLREGTVRDLPLVDRLMQAAFDPRFGEAWTKSQCLGVLAMPGVWLTIAALDEVPAGFALARITLDEAELLLLATAPAARRHGVGRSLLRAVEVSAQHRGARTLHLEVREGNSAIQLYRSAGFLKVGQRPLYYRGNDGRAYDAYTFSRNLE